MADLLLELGTEEIPAKFLARALDGLPGLLAARFADARVTHGAIRAIGTPRRVAVIAADVVDRQPDLSERVVGPPVTAAFAADGSPTKAAIGFAQKNGVDPATLEKSEAPGKKGLYVVATRFVAGRSTFEVLPELLAGVVNAIPWPKSMRWGWGEAAFVRPLHWIVALFGQEVVPVRWGNLEAGRQSRGHRFLAPGAVAIASAGTYVEALRQAFVVVDPATRRDLVAAELARVAHETGLTARRDDALLDEVANLVEYPVGVAGKFDDSYLEVPEEVIVTAMRNHQRYFALERAGGGLAPGFVTMAGTVTKNADKVRQGNERVLAARLSDARYFFREDQKKPLEDNVEKLNHVVFQAKLGNGADKIGDKIRRIERLVGLLAAELGAEQCDRAVALKAARFCKADLASGVVGEFPELQGVMGMHYARAAASQMPELTAAQVERVAIAIAEHYSPRTAGAELPATVEGALVAIADRIDTLVGCFATGLEPTGSADPLGLRRAAIGILQIALDRGRDGGHATPRWPTPFALINSARNGYDKVSSSTMDGAATALFEFFRTRLRGLLVDEGLSPQDVDAVLARAGTVDPTEVRARLRDVALLPAVARETFKRIANILEDASGQAIALDAGRLVQPAEKRLHEEFAAKQAEVHDAMANGRYREAIAVLTHIAPYVAAVFDRSSGVMIMDPDPELRASRLGLLQWILSPFSSIADFRLLAVAS